MSDLIFKDYCTFAFIYFGFFAPTEIFCFYKHDSNILNLLDLLKCFVTKGIDSFNNK